MPSTSDRSPYTRTELVWAGKRTHVDRVALPFQRVESVNAPRGGDMFSTAAPADGWRNKLIWGDNKLVMASLLQGDPAAGIESLAGKVDLIYIDPPFDTGADFSFRTQIGDEDVTKEPSVLEQLAYRDMWGRNVDSYLQMLYDRLILARDLLSTSGSVWVHVGSNICHYVRLLMDNVLGQDAYVNQVVWKRQTAHSDIGQGANHLGRVHDIVLLYARERERVRMEYAV